MSVANACPPSTEAALRSFADLPAGIGACVTVDLAALTENYRTIVDQVRPSCVVGAAVKADGYGLGLLPVSEGLARAGCRWFFVALPDEGLALAEALERSWPDARIAVLSGPWPGSAGIFMRYPALVPVLNDLGQLAIWKAASLGRPAILHLDTGMSRLGMPEDEAARLGADPSMLDGVPLAAVMSHLSCADDPGNRLAESQRLQFARLAASLPPAPRSLAASAGTFLGSGYQFDMVRIGGALFGLNPTPGRPNPMRPVVGIQARILQVRDVEPGASVGYGATWTADRPRRIATLAIGYADGILRSAGNQARCAIGGYSVPVIGRVSMDLVTVDVTQVPAPLVFPGGIADVVGPLYGVDDLARDSGTLGYEVLTRLGPRLPRIYRTGTA